MNEPHPTPADRVARCLAQQQQREQAVRDAIQRSTEALALARETLARADRRLRVASAVLDRAMPPPNGREAGR